MTIEIREIRREDAASYREGLDAVCREGVFLEGIGAPSLKNTQTFVQRSIERDYPHFVAARGVEIIGWCDAIPGEAEGLAQMGMAVGKAFRRQGIGRRLVEAVIAKAREKGLKKIELGVYASNQAAVTFYRKAGFAVEGKKPHARLADRLRGDVLVMGLRLAPPSDSPES
jgi:ribosomal protein S18 acetylase RimI-like enzyme